MPAARYNIVVEQGANFILSYIYREEDVVVSGVTTAGDPINITGATFEMQIREDSEDASTLKDWSAYFTLTTPLSGVFDLNVPYTQTLDYETEAAVYDIFMTLSGERIKLLYGKVKRSLDVTRA
jgi:hypothetical protein